MVSGSTLKHTVLCAAAGAILLAPTPAAADATKTTSTRTPWYSSTVPDTGPAGGGTSSRRNRSFMSSWERLRLPRGGASGPHLGGGNNQSKGKPKKNSKSKGAFKNTDGKQGQERQPKPTDPGQADEESSAAEVESGLRGDSKTGGASATPPPSQPISDTPPPPIVEEILRQDDYYKILGLDRQKMGQSTSSVIQKAYRRRAVLTHPDKTGGDRRAFDKVAEAYDVLSDESKRKVYDRFGKKGLEGHHFSGTGDGGGATPPFSSAEDLFRSFFGGTTAGQSPPGGGGRRSSNPYRRNRTVRYQLEVSLEDLYRGLTQSVTVSDSVMVGSGKTKRVQVHVPRGSFSGQSIRLSGEMDFDQSDTPGDLIFLVRQRPHATFTRKGHDLAVTLQISLQESICGLERTIRHLDGRDLVIASARHVTNDPILIQNGDVQVLRGQGMPKDAVGKQFGDLYVQFQVETPKPTETALLSYQEREELGRLLDKLEGKTNKKPSSTKQAGKKEGLHYLHPASLRDFGVASGQPNVQSNDDEDQDEEGFSTFQRNFYFSEAMRSNGFFGMGQPGLDDDSNVQCRQM